MTSKVAAREKLQKNLPKNPSKNLQKKLKKQNAKKKESEVSTAAKLTSQNKASEELDGTSEELDATSKEDHNSSNSSVLDALTGHCDEEDDSETISEDNK